MRPATEIPITLRLLSYLSVRHCGSAPYREDPPFFPPISMEYYVCSVPCPGEYSQLAGSCHYILVRRTINVDVRTWYGVDRLKSRQTIRGQAAFVNNSVPALSLQSAVR